MKKTQSFWIDRYEEKKKSIKESKEKTALKKKLKRKESSKKSMTEFRKKLKAEVDREKEKGNFYMVIFEMI